MSSNFAPSFQPRFYSILIFILFAFTQQSFAHNHENPDPVLEKILKQVLSATEQMHYDVAIDKASDLITKAEHEKNNKFIFHGYNLLSINYFQIRDSVHSLDYARKAMKYAERSQNDTLLVWAYNNLAAGLASQDDTRDEALMLYKKSLTIARKLNDGNFLDAALNIAELYRDQGKFHQMPMYLKEAENSLDPENISFDDPRIYLATLWGDYYRGVGKPENTADYYDAAYQLIEKDKIRFLAIEFYQRYASFLAESGDFSKAYEVQSQYQDYFKETDHINELETVQLAKARSEAEEFKRQRNEAELKRQLADQNLERKQIQSVLLAAILVLLIIFLGYLYKSTRLRKNLIYNLKRSNQELKDAKETAENSIKAKTKFFSTISHEMRTPLYGVTGIVSILENSPQIKKAHEEDLRSLKFSAGHLLDIINDLLDISKLETKNFKLDMRPLNIKLLIEEIISSLDQYHLVKSSKIHFNYDSKTPHYIIGDSRRISQVLLNILSNAVKFTQNGDIWLRLRSENISKGRFRLKFEIEDNGIGIAPKDQRLIFDEFSQIENIAQGGQTGTGLGLPIVKKLLEKMDSQISIKSELGKGATFSFAIDFKEATLLDVMEFGSSQNDLDSAHYNFLLSNASILIVDDNKINRIVTKKILDTKNVVTTQAENGEQALEKVKGGNFDLILMDINMPGMNGFETTKAIRKIDADIPIIALTAADGNYIEKEIKESGMNGAIIKPYSMDEFLNILIVHLSTRRKSLTL